MNSLDRVGLGWRGALAASTYLHLDSIDVIEVLLENYSSRELKSLRSLGREVPIIGHGVTLGLASVSPVATARLERLARVVNAL